MGKNLNLGSWTLLGMSLIWLLACERPIDWEIEPVADSQLVVEAILTNENRTQEINLSTSFAGLNDIATGVEDADVRVISNGETYLFYSDPRQSGRYLSQESFAIVAELEYKLSIHWEDRTYEASSKLAPVAPLQDIVFSPLVNRDSFFVSTSVVPLFNATQQAMYQFDIDWSHIHAQGLNQARMYFYTFSTVHNSQFIRPESDRVEFPSGSIVSIIKYGLSDDFAEFLQGQVIETDWNGAILYGNPENAVGNISNNGLGYFTTCAILKDTVVVE